LVPKTCRSKSVSSRQPHISKEIGSHDALGCSLKQPVNVTANGVDTRRDGVKRGFQPHATQRNARTYVRNVRKVLRNKRNVRRSGQ